MSSELTLFLSGLVTGPVTIEVDNARSVTNGYQARIAIAHCNGLGHRRHSISEVNKNTLRWGESPVVSTDKPEQGCRWAAASPSPPGKSRKSALQQEVKSVDEPIKLSLNKPMRLPSPTPSRPKLCCNHHFLQCSLPVLPKSREESRTVNVRELLDTAIFISTPSRSRGQLRGKKLALCNNSTL